jgi:hypothetical protein
MIQEIVLVHDLLALKLRFVLRTLEKLLLVWRVRGCLQVDTSAVIALLFENGDVPVLRALIVVERDIAPQYGERLGYPCHSGPFRYVPLSGLVLGHAPDEAFAILIKQLRSTTPCDKVMVEFLAQVLTPRASADILLRLCLEERVH